MLDDSGCFTDGAANIESGNRGTIKNWKIPKKTYNGLTSNDLPN